MKASLRSVRTFASLLDKGPVPGSRVSKSDMGRKVGLQAEQHKDRMK